MTSLLWKNRLSNLAIGLFFFFSGVEYAVILPTIWLYLKTDFHAQEYMLGLLLSGYSFAAVITGPILGRWSDKSRKPKFIIMVGVAFEIVGSFMYFLGISVWFLLGSRLVAGVGGGAEAVLMAEITRNCEEEKRTGLISIFVAIRQCGLLVGPGLNLFLRQMNFNIYHLHVNKYNAPGAFMACIWLIQVFVILFLYTDLHKLKDEALKISRRAEYTQSSGSPNPTTPLLQPSPVKRLGHRNRVAYDEDIYKQIDPRHRSPINGIETSENGADSLMESAEHIITSTNKMAATGAGSSSSYQNGGLDIDSEDIGYQAGFYGEDRGSRKGSKGSQDYINSNEEILEDYLQGKSKLKFMYQEYVREEVVTLIGTQFNSFFNQVALETMATPLANTLLDWGEIENSIMYCVAGVEIIAVFMLVRWLSSRLLDRTLIMVGLVTMTMATGWLLYAIPSAKPHDPSHNLWKFVISLVLDMFALPFLVSSSISLYSKITRKETQGLSMGLRRSVIGMATILAPLWAGSTIPFPYIMFGVMLGLLVISLVMMVLSFSKMKSHTEVPVNQAGIITTTTSYDEA